MRTNQSAKFHRPNKRHVEKQFVIRYSKSTHRVPCLLPLHPWDLLRRRLPRDLLRFHHCWECPHQKWRGHRWVVLPLIPQDERLCNRCHSVWGNFPRQVFRPVNVKIKERCWEEITGRQWRQRQAQQYNWLTKTFPNAFVITNPGDFSWPQFRPFVYNRNK